MNMSDRTVERSEKCWIFQQQEIHDNRPLLHLCVINPESTNQKKSKKIVKNYTFTVEEIVCFHLWYTKYLQSHAEDCLHGRCLRLLPFDTCTPRKCLKSSASVSQSWLWPWGGGGKTNKQTKTVSRAQNKSPAATGLITQRWCSTEPKTHHRTC